MVWIAASARTSFVESCELKAFKKLTKVFRHEWPDISNDEIVPLNAVANYLNNAEYFEGFNRNDWEQLISENVEGMQGKP